MPSTNSTSVKEKRACVRYSLPLRVFLNSKGEESNRLCNISKGGACFQSRAVYNPDDYIFFHFSAGAECPFADVAFSLLGKITRVDNGGKDFYTYGARFEFYNDPFSRQQYAKMVSGINRFTAASSHYRNN